MVSSAYSVGDHVTESEPPPTNSFSLVFLPVALLVSNEAIPLEGSPVLLLVGLAKRIRDPHPHNLLLPLHPPPSREAGLQGQLFYQHP